MTDPSSELPRLPLPLSHFRRHNDLVYISGQASVDENGKLVPGTFEEEFRRTLAILQRVLEVAGSRLDKVMQVRAYVRDPANLPLYNTLYVEYFREPYPARTTLTGCLPETLHFEIDCIAVITEERGHGNQSASG